MRKRKKKGNDLDAVCFEQAVGRTTASYQPKWEGQDVSRGENDQNTVNNRQHHNQSKGLLSITVRLDVTDTEEERTTAGYYNSDEEEGEGKEVGVPKVVLMKDAGMLTGQNTRHSKLGWQLVRDRDLGHPTRP